MRRARVMVLVLAVAASAAAAIPEPAAASVPAATDASRDTAQALLEYVPEADRASCARIDPRALGDGSFAAAAAILRCFRAAEGVDEVAYMAFDDTGPMDAAYDRSVPDGIPSADGVNVVCNTEGTWGYGDGADAGRDACFVTTEDDGVSVAKMVWTASTIAVLGYAIDADGGGNALKRWWNDDAGPLQEPTAVDGVASFDPADRKAVSRRLIKRLTRTDAKGCKPRGTNVVDAYSTDEPAWQWMPWVQADVDCKLPKSALNVTQLTPGDATYGYWQSFRGFLTDAGYESPSAAACSDAQPYEVDGVQVGEFWCWYFQNTLWASYYDIDRGLVTSATIPVKPRRAAAFLQEHGLL